MKHAMFKNSLKGLAAMAAVALASPASADVYDYTMTNGAVLSIDTVSSSATFTGSNINASMTSADFAGFTGGATPSFTAVLSSLDGTMLVNGTWMTDNPMYADTTHPQKLIMDRSGGVNLWAWWGDPIQGGDYLTTVASYAHTPSSSVPEPGVLGLLAAGLGGVAFARRRKARKGDAKTAKPKLALA